MEEFINDHSDDKIQSPKTTRSSFKAASTANKDEPTQEAHIAQGKGTYETCADGPSPWSE